MIATENQRGTVWKNQYRADIGKFLWKYLQIGKASDKSKNKETWDETAKLQINGFFIHGLLPPNLQKSNNKKLNGQS